MKPLKYIIYPLLLVTMFVNGQPNSEKSVPKERVFVHLNATFFFIGEYIYYKIYNINSVTNTKSNVSDIAYIELINDKLGIVFRHKIRLNNGQGQGDFFIATEIPSGNYKILGYTRYLQNFKPDAFFQANITIVNPYQSNQSPFLDQNTTHEFVNDIPAIPPEPSYGSNKKDYAFEIVLSKNESQQRENIRITLRNNLLNDGFGTYSISVRKKDGFKSPERPTAESFVNSIKKDQSKIQPSSPEKYLEPESRGSMLSGIIFDKNSGEIVTDLPIALNIPGENFDFQATTTDAEGRFRFTTMMDRVMNKGVLRIIHNDPNQYEIMLDKHQEKDYTGLQFDNFILDSTMKKALITRSTHNQIENAYFEIKPDFLTSAPERKNYFFYEKGRTYDLSEYTRFQTIEEVLTEIVKLAFTSRDEKGNNVIRVLERKGDQATPYPPLIFIDGLVVLDHSNLYRYDARLIKTIKVIQRSYQYGEFNFQGALFIETKDQNYLKHHMDSSGYVFNLSKPLFEKKYFQQSYETANADLYRRIPDYRYQLLWEPKIEINSSQHDVYFYTSDVEGWYEIVFEGISNNGIPVTVRKTFKVRYED